MQRIKNPLGSSRRGGLGAGPAWLKYDSRRTARPPPITAGSPAPARRGSPSISAGVHGGFRVDDEQTTAAAPGAGGRDMPGRALADALHRARVEKDAAEAERADRLQDKARHDAQFVTITRLLHLVNSSLKLGRDFSSPGRRVVLDVLRADSTPLFCLLVRRDAAICREATRWQPLPSEPVVSLYRGFASRDSQCYTTTDTRGADTSPDPLASALGLPRCIAGFNLEEPRYLAGFSSDALAVRASDVYRLFGLVDTAPRRPVSNASAPAAVQSEPAAAPEQPAEPVWKIDGKWTPEAKDEMRQQRRDGMSETAIAAYWRFSRSNLTELIGSLRNPKD